MDAEVPELSGHLIVPTQTGFSLISKKKTGTQKNALLFRASRHGIERLELYAPGDGDTRSPKILTLENCVKITHEPGPPAPLIHIVTKTDALTLQTLSADDLKLWLGALQSVAFQNKAPSVRAAAQLSAASSALHIEEDNDLYCSSYADVGVFFVRLVPSEASQKCSLIAHRPYVLHLTASELQLKSSSSSPSEVSLDTSAFDSPLDAIAAADQLAAKWPYRYIRKYGYRDGRFTFEAGRKCETGEGEFSLEHVHPLEVFRCMGSRMRTMKKLMSGEPVVRADEPQLPGIRDELLDCSEEQMNAVETMAAGSRSPLPPSLTQSTHGGGVIARHLKAAGQSTTTTTTANSSVDSAASGQMQRNVLWSGDSSVTNSSMATTIVIQSATGAQVPPPPPQKIVPNKPPRKLNTTTPSSNSSSSSKNHHHYHQNYEPVTPPAAESQKTLAAELKSGCGGGGRDDERPPELPVRNESKSSTNAALASPDRDYECIPRTIQEPWRTQGIDEPWHTEPSHGVGGESEEFAVKSPQPPQRQQHSSNSAHSSSQHLLSSTSASNKTTVSVTAIAAQYQSPSDDYDRLQFFAPKVQQSSSATMLNGTGGGGQHQQQHHQHHHHHHHQSSDYKTIITLTQPGYKTQTSLPASLSVSSSNDYELIGACTTTTTTSTTMPTATSAAAAAKKQSLDLQLTKSRPANDSFMGYGQLRKASGSGAAMVEVSPGSPVAGGGEQAENAAMHPHYHRPYNEMSSYAIVSKPKRV